MMTTSGVDASETAGMTGEETASVEETAVATTGVETAETTVELRASVGVTAEDGFRGDKRGQGDYRKQSNNKYFSDNED